MAPLFLEVRRESRAHRRRHCRGVVGARIKTPRGRHAAWTAVVLAMLLLPLWSIARISNVAAGLAPAPAARMCDRHRLRSTRRPVGHRRVDVCQSTPVLARATPLVSTLGIDWQLALLGVYVAGVFVLLLRLSSAPCRRTVFAAALIHEGRATSDRCTTPITVGWFCARADSAARLAAVAVGATRSRADPRTRARAPPRSARAVARAVQSRGVLVPSAGLVARAPARDAR